MKVVITGSRSLSGNTNIQYFKVIDSVLKWIDKPIDEIVSGEAVGPDQWGKQYGLMMGTDIKSEPAEWNTYGKAAGPIRNRRMAEYGDFAIIFWDGVSAGSLNMMEEMDRLNKPYILKLYNTRR